MTDASATWLLYDNPLSGNCWKARQILAWTGTPFTSEEVSVLGDRDKARKGTPVGAGGGGRIPLLVHPDGTELRESNGILLWFAEGTEWLPQDRGERQRVMEWLFFEQSMHMPWLGAARYMRHVLKVGNQPAGVLAYLDGRQAGALGKLEQRLSAADWMAIDRPTIADIALYPYTRMAPHGAVDLGRYPAVQTWLGRFEALPGFVPLPCL